uniref:Uncharacterized protein n=1 Tax=Oryza punctata TaxID=4537 RepID=A0A0E0JLX6_ORYPU
MGAVDKDDEELRGVGGGRAWLCQPPGRAKRLDTPARPLELDAPPPNALSSADLPTTRRSWGFLYGFKKPLRSSIVRLACELDGGSGAWSSGEEETKRQRSEDRRRPKKRGEDEGVGWAKNRGQRRKSIPVATWAGTLHRGLQCASVFTRLLQILRSPSRGGLDWKMSVPDNTLS